MDISQLMNGMAKGVQSPNGRSAQASPEGVGRTEAGKTREANASQSAVAEAKIDANSLRDAVDKVNEAMRTSGHNLEFSMDEETGIRLVKVVDKESGEVIRQLPSKEVLEIAKSIESMKSLLLSDKV